MEEDTGKRHLSKWLYQELVLWVPTESVLECVDWGKKKKAHPES